MNEATATDLRVFEELKGKGWKKGDTLIYQPQYKLTEEQQKQFQDRKYIKPDFVLQNLNGEILVVIENKYKFYASNQVAKGAQKWLDFTLYNKTKINNTTRCIDNLRSKGYQIVATSPHNESCVLQDFDVTKKSAFFFGVEKEGLSKEVLTAADVSLKIPMVGFTESLNISVAAAIVLQTLTEKLKRADVDWGLSDLEKSEKYLEWLEKSIKSIQKIKKLYYEKD